MSLDPQIRAMLERAASAAAAGGVALSSLPPPVARAGFRTAVLASLGDGHRPTPARVRDSTVPGPAGPVPVRVYRPDSPAALPSVLPVVLFAHAGGWVIGDLETHDELCRRMTRTLPALVVAVDYRLAPEHPFPAAHDDHWAVLRWLAEHARELGGDPDRLAVVGDSAGGNLAASAALRARAAGGPRIAVQAMAYPLLDATMTVGAQDASSVDGGGSLVGCAEGYGLTAATLRWFLDCYLPDPADRAAPEVSPLLVEDLSGLPPAVLATAGYDPLRTEGDAYAARLAQAGVPVVHQRADDLVHGFCWHTRISPAADRATQAFLDALRSRLHPRHAPSTDPDTAPAPFTAAAPDTAPAPATRQEAPA